MICDWGEQLTVEGVDYSISCCSPCQFVAYGGLYSSLVLWDRHLRAIASLSQSFTFSLVVASFFCSIWSFFFLFAGEPYGVDLISVHWVSAMVWHFLAYCE